MQCTRAQRFMRECYERRKWISPAPRTQSPPPEPHRRPDHDEICEVLRGAMLELDAMTAAEANRKREANGRFAGGMSPG